MFRKMAASTTTNIEKSTDLLFPSFSGILTGFKSPRGPIHAPEQWEFIKDKIKVIDAKSVLIPPQTYTNGNNPPPPREGFVRICCVSDTHNNQDTITAQLPAKADILIVAGDFSDTGHPKDIAKFCEWITKIRDRFKHVLVCAGNHELSLCRRSYPVNWKRFRHEQHFDTEALENQIKSVCTYVNHETVQVCGLKIFMSPWSAEFGGWGFNASRDNGELYNLWKQIPTDVDVVVTHGPAMGHGDICLPENKHFGDADLLDWIEKYQPKLAIAGHIHEGYGATTNGKTVFLNPSTMNMMYDPRRPNPPMMIDLAVGPKK
jgi:Icc-related predicted phosphoesterase